MTGPRLFCRFQPDRKFSPAIHEIPPEGFCLDVFWVVRRRDAPNQVLLGQIEPREVWQEVGGIMPSRLAEVAEGWMLPSSHLVYGESPDAAARRVASEQLGLSLEFPTIERVVSETYRPSYYPHGGDHWDLQFIYGTRADPETIRPPSGLWRRLEFRSRSDLDGRPIVRSHGDILDYVGVR